MQSWIALLRGINVGGNNKLPMAKLKTALESIKLANVRTYIQSGNVVFESSAKSSLSLGKKIAKRIEQEFGFEPRVLVLSANDFRAAMEENPYPQATSEPKTLHFYFLASEATAPDHEAMESAKSPTESYSISKRIFYLHAPDGIGRSKLAANAEKYLGVATTARNYRTVEAIAAMTSLI